MGFFNSVFRFLSNLGLWLMPNAPEKIASISGKSKKEIIKAHEHLRGKN